MNPLAIHGGSRVNLAGNALARALVVSMVGLVSLLAAGPASGAIVINEVETQGTDFVELHNTDLVNSVDISSYAVDDDSATPAAGAQVPAATTIAAGGFFVVTPAMGLPGLGAPDAVHLYDAG